MACRFEGRIVNPLPRRPRGVHHDAMGTWTSTPVGSPVDPLRLAQRLAAGCTALRGLSLRASFVGERLRVWPPETAVAVLDACRALADAGDSAAADTLMAASSALSAPTAPALRRRLSVTAIESGREELATMLRTWPPWRPSASNLPHGPELERGRPLTLGERKSLARRADRRMLRRVLLDPHPSVLDVVLRHPALTEADVVALAARRPARPELLARIFAAPRWLARHRVRVALLRNPWCPLDVALQLVPHVRRPELLAAGAARELDPTLRRACLRAARTAREAH